MASNDRSAAFVRKEAQAVEGLPRWTGFGGFLVRSFFISITPLLAFTGTFVLVCCLVVLALALLGWVACALAAVAVVLGMAAPAAIFVRLDAFLRAANEPAPPVGVITRSIHYTWNLCTAFILPGVAIVVGVLVVSRFFGALRRRVTGKLEDGPCISAWEVKEFVSGLAASLCWYNQLSRLQNGGQLPELNAWLGLLAIALLFALLTNVPNILAGTLPQADTQPLITKELEKPRGYGTTECEEVVEVVVEKIEGESSAMLWGRLGSITTARGRAL